MKLIMTALCACCALWCAAQTSPDTSNHRTSRRTERVFLHWKDFDLPRFRIGVEGSKRNKDYRNIWGSRVIEARQYVGVSLAYRIFRGTWVGAEACYSEIDEDLPSVRIYKHRITQFGYVYIEQEFRAGKKWSWPLRIGFGRGRARHAEESRIGSPWNGATTDARINAFAFGVTRNFGPHVSLTWAPLTIIRSRMSIPGSGTDERMGWPLTFRLNMQL